MKVLIIGYGSIGKRHDDVLLKFENITRIDIVTKQIIQNRQTYLTLSEVENISIYDYFIIASETNKHLEQLKYIDSVVKDKLIFCEKPLFETQKNLTVKNSVFVGYVLRFHPLLQKLKQKVEKEKIISINVNCGQYLPSWRPNSCYQNSYSAKKEEGGGVLLDLSHEIDYVQWLCGELSEIKSFQVKVSDLEIDSDDLVTFIARAKNGAMINISIDYITKITYRTMFVNTIEKTYKLDFIDNTLISKDKLGFETKESLSNLERDFMFEQMHKSVLTDHINVCTYNEAKNVMNTIKIIQEQNNE
ncbi:MAG: Gfo/Idh/MocA family oxidoreductase [Arcobacteraceae bacterium]|nr:Gfo/Idh/MocA family oxidoreductase [Arcobacteraceae bacterium]